MKYVCMKLFKCPVKMTVDEVLKVVKRDADYYEASGGGVTASGGEILDRPILSLNCLNAVGNWVFIPVQILPVTAGKKDMAKILEYSDLIYFDLKHMDAEEHIKMCGQSNELVLSNLALVVAKGVP